MGRERLTAPQRTLLAEIAEAGVLYVRRGGPYHRTVDSLVRKGYAVISEPDYSRMGQDGYSVVGNDAPASDDTMGTLAAEATALMQRLACLHAFDPECSRCDTLAGLRRAVYAVNGWDPDEPIPPPADA